MLKSYTDTPDNFKYIKEYKHFLNYIVERKTDYLWKNWLDFKIEDQSALTVGIDNGEVKVISSIVNKSIWKKGVYRLLNRYYVLDSYRDVGGTKTHRGEGYNIAHILLNDQLKYLNSNLKYSFYFLSRQKNKRFLNYWVNTFNKKYDKNLTVSDKRYWVCNGSAFNCHQILVYNKDYDIPFTHK